MIFVEKMAKTAATAAAAAKNLLRYKASKKVEKGTQKRFERRNMFVPNAKLLAVTYDRSLNYDQEFARFMPLHVIGSTPSGGLSKFKLGKNTI